jgi:tetratricopeptide (TPR) repeat protein
VSRGKIEAAIREYRRLLEQDPEDTGTLNRVGDLYSRVNKYDEAIELYRETAERFVDEGFYVKAIAVYKKIHRLDANQLDVYEKLARLYAVQGLVKDARTQYEVLADYYENEGKVEAAIGICREVVKLEPQNPSHRIRLADLYEQLGQTGDVVSEYLEIGRIMLDHGKLEKAVQLLDRAFEMHPGSADLVVEAVLLLRAHGQRAISDEFLSRAEDNAEQSGREEAFASILERVLERDVAEVEPPAAVAEIEETAAPDPSREDVAAPVLESEPDDTLVLEPPEEDLATVAEEVEEQAAAAVPKARESQGRLEDLLDEVEVFVGYGFKEKALDRLGDVIREFPDAMPAYRQLLTLLLEDRSYRAAVEAANQMSAAALRTGAREDWDAMRARLESDGFLIEGDQVKAGPAMLHDDSEEIDLLDPKGADLQAIIDSAREASSAHEDDVFVLDPPQGDVVPVVDGKADSPVGFNVVDDEFADLAAEVEKEIEAAAGAPAESPDTPSLEEIVESFKQGVAENLSSEDFDTHYNLGIAYREMGLIDEAVGEFEIAAQSSDYFIGCCSLLGLCHRDRGDFDGATGWYRKGLDTSDLLVEERLALLYDLADTYELSGDTGAARETFGELASVDAAYRDIEDRLAALH